MTESSFKLLQHVSKIKNLFRENDIDLTDNIILKRKIIDDLKKHEFNVTLSKEDFDLIVNDTISLLECSGINETY
jgi:hypothetical protein